MPIGHLSDWIGVLPGAGVDPKDPKAGFNMTAFALRASAHHCGVSRRHGEVARRMWRSLWPDLPEDKVPIDHITNGIHVPTWIEPRCSFFSTSISAPTAG